MQNPTLALLVVGKLFYYLSKTGPFFYDLKFIVSLENATIKYTHPRMQSLQFFHKIQSFLKLFQPGLNFSQNFKSRNALALRHIKHCKRKPKFYIVKLSSVKTSCVTLLILLKMWSIAHLPHRSQCFSVLPILLRDRRPRYIPPLFKGWKVDKSLFSG